MAAPLLWRRNSIYEGRVGMLNFWAVQKKKSNCLVAFCPVAKSAGGYLGVPWFVQSHWDLNGYVGTVLQDSSVKGKAPELSSGTCPQAKLPRAAAYRQRPAAFGSSSALLSSPVIPPIFFA